MRLLLPAFFLLSLQPAKGLERYPLNAWEVLRGGEPALSIALARLPLPPTRAEAEAGGVRYQQERVAIKRAWVYRTSLAKAERNRISAENNRSTAALARHLGAPAVFCEYLEHLASGDLSRREERAAEQALRHVAQDIYGVDVLRIRQVSETLKLAPAAHALAMLEMPVASMYDTADVPAPARELVLSDIQTITTVLRQTREILALVHDRNSADAAAKKLATLLPLWSTTLPTRAHAAALAEQLSPAERLSVNLLNHTTGSLMKKRKELDKNGWYGSELLLIMDEQLR